MAKGRPSQQRGELSTLAAQDKFLKLRAGGMTVKDAITAVGRTEKTYEYWRSKASNAAEFRERADQIKALNDIKADERRPQDISFEEFSEKYLGQRLFWHQLQWVDILEGREPRDLHPAETYIKGDPLRVVVNTPPFHAKSTTLTMNYVTYRICKDPNIRILLVSQTLDMAKKFLAGIKYRLSHPRYKQLQIDFAPQGGWQSTADAWTTEMIYIGGERRDSGEKDPTIQALGMGGQIYGARADLVILDDTITGKNSHEAEKQLTWLNTEVDSRIEEDTGILAIVGTRISPDDLYGKLTDPATFASEDEESDEAPWTYFAQPAVLEYADRREDWQTLWPRADQPWAKDTPPDADGLYPRWDGTRLAKKRRKLGPRMWALVYMQQGISEDSIFNEFAVKRAVNGMRKVGPMKVGAPGHRREGMDNLWVIGSVDPSGSGQTACIVYAVDPKTAKRYVLQAKTFTPWSWPVMRALVMEWTEQFGIHEWVTEKNMYHSAFRHDEDTTRYLQNRGVRMVEHFTGSNKIDPDIGVASLAPLFGEYDGQQQAVIEPMIELPSTIQSETTKRLIEQLVAWQPNGPKNAVTDLVMALWFAELRARERLSRVQSRDQSFVNSRWLSSDQRSRQQVVNIRDWMQAVG